MHLRVPAVISRSRSRRHRLVAATVGGALLVAACSTTTDAGGDRGSAATSPATTTASGPAGTAGSTAPAPPPLRWTTCQDADEVECASLTVPLDHADPGGRTIDLAVARRAARDPDERLGALVFNPGGPGASGVDYVQASATFEGIGDRFDIVSWDPRGIGRSAPVRCEEQAAPYQALDWSPDDAVERDALDEGATAVAEDCAADDVELLGHLSTEDTARDLDLLRAALGDEQLTYVGFSYGTLIGLRYADLFPARVRAIVLDGVVDPTNDLGAALEDQTRALDQATREVFSACDRAASCPVSDAGATYDRLAAQVEERPIPAGGEVVGPTALAYAVIGSAYSASASRNLLAGMAAAERGDGRQLARLADGYFSTSSYGSYLATVCVDSPHPTGSTPFTELEDRLAEVSPRFGAAVANEVRPCAFWAAPATGSVDPVHAAGAAPILVVGNRGDFATPYDSAVRVADELDHGVLLTYDGQGHLSYGKSTCVDDAVNDYLTDLTLPDEGTTCS